MEPEGPVPRGRPGTSLGGSSQALETRNPGKLLSPEEFTIHFRNGPLSSQQKSTYLCYQVKSVDHHRSPVLLASGVFQNQYDSHAEHRFLTEFRKMQSPDLRYRITWYISWSPCGECAEHVAKFLKENPRVSLSISAARVYYPDTPGCQEGLRRLQQAGAQIRIASLKDFKFCWENFVDKGSQQFQQWKELVENYWEEVKKLNEILRNLLKKEIFNVQFNNHRKVQKPFQKRMTYLCYQLKLLPDDGSTLDQNCFQNQNGRHAEIHFIKKINSMPLEENQRYQITCYVTWSPCPDCASQLVEFVQEHSNLSLKLFAARLYFHWRWDYIRGLQQLKNSNISVAVMSAQEFADCWRKFVDHEGKAFRPWQKLEQWCNSINRRLGRILKDLNPDDLNNDFRKLQLESPSTSSDSE